jgi:predicted metal-dependent hydrolase
MGHPQIFKPMDAHEKERLYREGLEAFNSSRFFEAHELWEDVWRETPEPDKKFLQGLIQVAAAFHHHSRANLLGMQRQLQAGLLKLEAFPEVYGELEIEPLRHAVRGWLAAVALGEVPKEMQPPQIRRPDKSQPRT